MSAAENILQAYLLTSGDDVEALRLLARIEHQRDVLDKAELLLEAALKLVAELPCCSPGPRPRSDRPAEFRRRVKKSIPC